MKTIKLNITGVSLLANGEAAILTKPSTTNPSANGVHKVNAGQLNRLCMRTLGFYSPIALQQAINVSNGSAVLTIQAEDIKAGQPWENKTTGETGVHTKDYVKYSNHEIEVGFAASMKMFEIAAQVGIQSAATFTSPVVKKAPVNTNLGIPADTTTATVDEPTV